MEEKKKEDTPVVDAPQLETKPDVTRVIIEPKKAFIYFTHSQEAFRPILAAQGEKVAIYHPISNITTFKSHLPPNLHFINWRLPF